LVIGAYVATQNTQTLVTNFPLQNPQIITQAGYALIILGCITFLIGFFGCCGSMVESRTLLGFYATFLITICLVEIVFGVLASIFYTRLVNELVADLNANYSLDANFTASMDTFQTSFNCCGILGKSDYKNSYYSNTSNTAVPPTCCQNYKSTVTSSPLYQFCAAWPTGCMQAFKNKLNMPVIYAVGAVIGFIEIVGLICAFCLCHAIAKQSVYEQM